MLVASSWAVVLKVIASSALCFPVRESSPVVSSAASALHHGAIFFAARIQQLYTTGDVYPHFTPHQHHHQHHRRFLNRSDDDKPVLLCSCAPGSLVDQQSDRPTWFRRQTTTQPLDLVHALVYEVL